MQPATSATGKMLVTLRTADKSPVSVFAPDSAMADLVDGPTYAVHGRRQLNLDHVPPGYSAAPANLLTLNCCSASARRATECRD